VKSLRNSCTGRWPVHSFQKNGGVAAALILGAAAILAPAPAEAQTTSIAVAAADGQSPAPQTVADFYKARKGAPLWFSSVSGDAAEQLISLLSTASVDGLTPDRYQPAALQSLVQTARAKNKRKDVERADQALSQAFVAYVDDLRTDPGVGITWVDPQLRPIAPSALAALLQASAAPSLADYVGNFGWMHPFYGELRRAIAEHKYSDDQQRGIL